MEEEEEEEDKSRAKRALRNVLSGGYWCEGRAIPTRHPFNRSLTGVLGGTP